MDDNCFENSAVFIYFFSVEVLHHPQTLFFSLRPYLFVVEIVTFIRIKSENCFVMLQHEAFLPLDVLCEGLWSLGRQNGKWWRQTFGDEKRKSKDVKYCLQSSVDSRLLQNLFCMRSYMRIPCLILRNILCHLLDRLVKQFSRWLVMERRVFAFLLEVLQGAELRRPPDPGWNPLIGFGGQMW